MIEKLSRFHDRTMASFIIDDVCGFTAEDVDAYRRMSEFVGEAGLRGECSGILGLQRDEQGRALPVRRDYAAQVARCAPILDAYMEIMTHNYLYDFAADRIRSDGPHEGVWLLNRSVSVEQYANYFRSIITRGQELGFRFSGLTIPGCGCEPCVAAKKALNIQGLNAFDFNRNVHAALVQLLREGLFSSNICGLFVGSQGQGTADVVPMLEAGAVAVYDTPPGTSGDHLGRWENETRYLNPDLYITPDGSGGRLAELLELRSPTMIYYGHWQSLRPDRGVGFASFKELAARLSRHRGEQITWMRPTQIAAYRHIQRHTRLRESVDGRSFELSVPFAASSPLSLRILGRPVTRLRAPGGQMLQPWRTFPAESAAIFDIVPENGIYTIEG